MNIKTLLKFKTTLTEKDERIILEIVNKIETSSITSNRTKGYILPIIKLLQKGLAIDSIKFLDKVFFDFYVIRTNTEPHLKRIYQQLTEIGKFKEDSHEEQTHLVNLYRNIVVDAFDPYLNLLVATLQFIDGKYTSMQETNLGLGERNKFDYAFSKLKPTNLFQGYNPIVRNAISHTGTEGVIYKLGQVVFRDIKRGVPPSIKYEVWSNQILRERILELMDFVNAVDNSIEIIGFDSSELIKEDKYLSNKFFDEILTKKQRLDFQNELEIQVKKIVEFESNNFETKLAALNFIFNEECKKRGTPINSITFNYEKKLIRIEVPVLLTKLKYDENIIDKALKLARYGIIAVLLYKFHFEIFVISEMQIEDLDCVSVEISKVDLDDYAKEEIGLYDILNDSNIYFNGEKIDVTVDFEKLNNIEYSSTSRRFPRRVR